MCYQMTKETVKDKACKESAKLILILVGLPQENKHNVYQIILCIGYIYIRSSIVNTHSLLNFIYYYKSVKGKQTISMRDTSQPLACALTEQVRSGFYPYVTSRQCSRTKQMTNNEQKKKD